MEFLFSYTTRLINSTGLCVLSIILYLVFRQKTRFFCMLAMIISAVSVAFIKNPADAYSSAFSAAVFCSMISNILFGLGFFLESRRKKYIYRNLYFNAAVFLTLICILLISSLTVIFSADASGLLKVILLFLCIGFNAASQFSYASNEDGYSRVLIVSALMILLSSFLKFVPIEEFLYISENITSIIYPMSQLIIILFCADFRRKAS